MKFRNFKLCLAGALASLLLMAACSDSSPNSNEPIKVGVITSLTGTNTAFGQAHKAGYTIAVNEINARGGVNGRKIRLVYFDDQSKPDRAAQGVAKLVDEDHVALLLGAYSSESTQAIVPVVTAKQVPLIIPTAVADNIMQSQLAVDFPGVRGFGRLCAGHAGFPEEQRRPQDAGDRVREHQLRAGEPQVDGGGGQDRRAGRGGGGSLPGQVTGLRGAVATGEGAQSRRSIYFASYLFDANVLMRQAAAGAA